MNWTYNDTHHYKDCDETNCTYVTDKATHSMNWDYDDTHHWKECGQSGCNRQTDYNTHDYTVTYTNNGTTHTKNEDCNTCTQPVVKTTGLSHGNYVYSDTNSDSTHKASCGYNGCTYYYNPSHDYSNGVCRKTGCGHKCTHSSKDYRNYTSLDSEGSKDKGHSYYWDCNYCDKDNNYGVDENAHSSIADGGSCDDCGYTPHVHIYDVLVTTNSQHIFNCACGKPGTWTNHDWGTALGEADKCKTCKYTHDCYLVKSTKMATDEVNHYKMCNTSENKCNYQGYYNHTYTNGVCNGTFEDGTTCGYVCKHPTSNYKYVYTSNGNGSTHKKQTKCGYCNQVVATDNSESCTVSSWSDWAKHNASQHVQSGTCSKTGCGQTVYQYGDHKWGTNQGADTDECQICPYECPCSSKSYSNYESVDENEHSFTWSCNNCDYEENDTERHQMKGTECELCDYSSHTCSFGGWSDYNTTYHRKYCSCGNYESGQHNSSGAYETYSSDNNGSTHTIKRYSYCNICNGDDEQVSTSTGWCKDRVTSWSKWSGDGSTHSRTGTCGASGCGQTVTQSGQCSCSSWTYTKNGTSTHTVSGSCSTCSANMSLPVENCSPNYGSWSYAGSGEHERSGSCSESCGNTFTDSGDCSSYSNSVCTDCGGSCPNLHGNLSWSKDSGGHWIACSRCDYSTIKSTHTSGTKYENTNASVHTVVTYCITCQYTISRSTTGHGTLKVTSYSYQGSAKHVKASKCTSCTYSTSTTESCTYKGAASVCQWCLNTTTYYSSNPSLEVDPIDLVDVTGLLSLRPPDEACFDGACESQSEMICDSRGSPCEKACDSEIDCHTNGCYQSEETAGKCDLHSCDQALSSCAGVKENENSNRIFGGALKELDQCEILETPLIPTIQKSLDDDDNEGSS